MLRGVAPFAARSWPGAFLELARSWPGAGLELSWKMSWSYVGAFARPRNHSFLAGKLTFLAQTTVRETQTFRIIETVRESCQQIPRTKIELFADEVYQAKLKKQRDRGSETRTGAPKIALKCRQFERQRRPMAQNSNASTICAIERR